ncbi:hypothetical protein MTO96_016529 [Rhipicephalus appendiculatus]
MRKAARRRVAEHGVAMTSGVGRGLAEGRAGPPRTPLPGTPTAAASRLGPTAQRRCSLPAWKAAIARYSCSSGFLFEHSSAAHAEVA